MRTRRRTIVTHLNQLIDEGHLLEDRAQRVVAEKLLRLQKTLVGYDNSALIDQIEKRDKERLRQIQLEKDMIDGYNPNMVENEATYQNAVILPTVPRGLYIYGTAVGTGKSLLMDTFYATTDFIAKRHRYHFHAFMNMVHQRIHLLKQTDLEKSGRDFKVNTAIHRNPVYRVGVELSREMSLLCLDEFQVIDIADALILRLLFSTLWSRGTVVVATSNRRPTDLYQGGINFGYFEPFIALLEKHCIVHAMTNELDYRLLLTNGMDSMYFVLQKDGDESAERATRANIDTCITGLRGDAKPVENLKLILGHNRTLTIAQADDKGLVAQLHFESLCHSDLGASDYRRLAQAFDVVFIEHIPILTLENHNAARRFITLIDELYENRTCLMCNTTAGTPNDLFVQGFADGETLDGDMPDGWIDEATNSGGHAIGALASVQELSFAFKRAASRIKEMTSLRWLEKQRGKS
jgi:predicted ATPase